MQEIDTCSYVLRKVQGHVKMVLFVTCTHKTNMCTPANIQSIKLCRRLNSKAFVYERKSVTFDMQFMDVEILSRDVEVGGHTSHLKLKGI